jgi:hypothetical protein
VVNECVNAPGPLLSLELGVEGGCALRDTPCCPLEESTWSGVASGRAGVVVPTSLRSKDTVSRIPKFHKHHKEYK